MTARLEDLKPDAVVKGLVGREAVRIITAQMMGEAAQVVYRDGQGTIDTQILFRDKEAELEIVSAGRKWSFEGDGDQFRLVSEAERIRLAYLFDPYVAVSTRSARSTSTCCPGSRCASCWPTIRGRARRSWPAC